jgi:hypothetical protein
MTPSRPRAPPATPSKPAAPSRTGPGQATVDWLLESSQPSIRYLTLTSLLHRAPSDPEVLATRSEVPRVGWAAELLASQLPSGVWAPEEDPYRPKYRSTHWKMLVLSDLGVTRDDPRIARGCERWMTEMNKPDGGFGFGQGATGHLCVTGNAVRALIRFGYGEDARVQDALGWLVSHQAKLGGWSCWGSGRNLDSWEPMSAFAALPNADRSPAIVEAVRRGAEFFLSRELYRQGAPYPPWERFHYPAHYYYDLLVGLDFLTALGYAGDPRMGYALSVLRARRRPDGRWNLDAVHPDVEGSMAEWYVRHPRDRPTPFALETVGAPSKMVTLTALRVLDALERPGPSTEPGPAVRSDLRKFDSRTPP